MNDKKFIELLNLYVDREISSEEAAALEQAIASSPERRKVYLQYCRIHKASVMLAESYRSDSIPEGSILGRAASDADRKIAEFPSRQSRGPAWAWFTGLGVAAAAACVALVVVRNEGASTAPIAPRDVTFTSTERTSSPQLVATPIPITSVAVANRERAKVGMFVNAQAPMDQVVFAGSNAETLAWMDGVQLPVLHPVAPEKLVFEAKTQGHPEQRVFRTRGTSDAKVEMTAFEFQK